MQALPISDIQKIVAGGGAIPLLFIMPILFDKDPITGVTQYYDYDPVNDIHMIHNVQDFTPLVEKLKQAQNDPDVWKRV